MSKIGSKLNFAWKLFLAKLLSMKTLTLLLLLGILYHIFLSPVKSFSQSVNYPVCPWIFPFLISDIYFVILFMSAVVYYFSDVPFMKEWTMYQVIRTGRVEWACGQIGSIIFSSFAFIVIAIFETGLMLLPNITLSEGWGKVLYTLSMTNAAGEYRIPFSVSYDIINKFGTFQAMGISILMGGLVIMFIGLLMFSLSLYISRLWANIIAMLFVILPIVVENIGDIVPWLVYCSPISWMRMSEIDVRSGMRWQMPTALTSSIILLIACIVLSATIIWKIHGVDFKLIKED